MAIEKMCKNCGKTYRQYNTLQNICQTCAFNRYAKAKKPIKRVGKQAKLWISFREQWFKDNEPDVGGFYICGICGLPVHIDEVVLDHKLPRSNRPDLRYNTSNIQPAHYECNTIKGSKH